jgi:dipeptidyl-peptidase-3
MMAYPPYSLGFPNDLSQSAYYPGELRITKDEIALVSQALEERLIYPENTRIRKIHSPRQPIFEVLQASVQCDDHPQEFSLPDSKGTVRIIRGDHANELDLICHSLAEACKHGNELQQTFLKQYIESFQTGSLDVYRDSQRDWIKDKGPRIENIFGFVEPYRDPFGSRAEFEGIVGISDVEETKTLKSLVDNSEKFIRRLPWADPTDLENNGKGPFEKSLFEPPDFASIQSICCEPELLEEVAKRC